MIKGVILSDCHGNKIAVAESWIKRNGHKNDRMFLADNSKQKYEEGDYCDLAVWPFYNSVVNPKTHELEILPVPKYIDDCNVSVCRYFYHNGTFQIPWETDQQLDIDIHDIEWQDIEKLEIEKLL